MSHATERLPSATDAYNFHMLAGLVTTISFALAFAGLLQEGNAGGQQPVAPATPAASTGQESKPQESKQGSEGILATILQSGSTNSRAYKVAIHNDGGASVEFNDASSDSRGGPLQQFPHGTIDVVTLRRLLTEIGDVSKIQTGGCAKSASFGTRTQIGYAGKTSGDLQCVEQTAPAGDQMLLHESEHLARLVLAILVQLKFDDRLIIPNK